LAAEQPGSPETLDKNGRAGVFRKIDAEQEDTMMSNELLRFVEAAERAVVATADSTGHPHLALGSNIKTPDGNHLVFENWFCQTTLRNLEQNPSIAVAILAEGAEFGYQFNGRVVHGFDVAILDGYVPGAEPPGEPQTLTRLVVKVEEIMAFCAGIDTDQPLSS